MTTPKRIMVVEDDHVSRLMLSRFLELKGFEVLTATNGQEALDVLSDGPGPDVILMDIQMPVLNGMDTTLAIREGQVESLDRAVPIVAITAHALEEERDKLLGIGMNDFLAKPVNMDDLAVVLDGLIS